MLWKRKYRWKQYHHFLYRQCCYFLSSQLPSYDLFSMLRVVFAGNGSNRRARVTFTKYVCLLLLHSANHSFSDILIENECNMRPNLFYLEVFSLPKVCLKSQKMWKNSMFPPKVRSLVSSVLSCLVLSLQLAFKLETLPNSLLAFYSFSF